MRFGAYEADLRTGELRMDGVKLKSSGPPFLVLAIHSNVPATQESGRIWVLDNADQ